MRIRLNDLQPPPVPNRAQRCRWQDVAVEEQQERIRRFDQVSQTMPAGVNGFHFRHSEPSQPVENFDVVPNFSRESSRTMNRSTGDAASNPIHVEVFQSAPQPNASGRHAGPRSVSAYSQPYEPLCYPSHPSDVPTLRHYSTLAARSVRKSFSNTYESSQVNEGIAHHDHDANVTISTSMGGAMLKVGKSNQQLWSPCDTRPPPHPRATKKAPVFDHSALSQFCGEHDAAYVLSSESTATSGHSGSSASAARHTTAAPVHNLRNEFAENNMASMIDSFLGS